MLIEVKPRMNSMDDHFARAVEKILIKCKYIQTNHFIKN